MSLKSSTLSALLQANLLHCIWYAHLNDLHPEIWVLSQSSALDGDPASYHFASGHLILWSVALTIQQVFAIEPMILSFFDEYLSPWNPDKM